MAYLYYQDPAARIYVGDARDMSVLPDESVQCVVTSPPYWGLRDYGIDGDGAIGLEPTPEEYTANIVDVFGEVWRVLRNDGTAWLNLGDSYSGSGKGGNEPKFKNPFSKGINGGLVPVGLKPKDLVGVPWRVAFALQADGWYLRQDIIWSKPNPMPESVRDRFTRSHEYIFLLSKSRQYHFDQEAILEPASEGTHARLAQNVQAQVGSDRANGGRKTNGNMKAVGRLPAEWATGMDRSEHGNIKGNYTEGRKLAAANSGIKNNRSFDEAMAIMPVRRNKRSVWEITPQQYKEAHFATFPEALVEPCVMAGSRPGDIVLDPFMGSGTMLWVAKKLGRQAVGFDLKPEYCELAVHRLPQMAMVME